MQTTLQSRISVSDLYKTASLTAIGLISYFLLMKLLHLNTVVELRFANFFIVLYGVRTALLHKRFEDGGRLDYLPGMLIGFMTAFLAAFFFATFVFIYLQLDVKFMTHLQVTQPFGLYLTPASSALVTFMEGVSSGAIIAFLVMHLMNRDVEHG